MSSKKKSQANKNRSSKNSEIIFVRRYPFYCSVQNQSKSKSTSKTNVTTESYYFQVTVSALAPFHESTGMTVDLVQLDRVAKKIFKPDGSAQFTLKSLLKNKRALLEKALKLKKTRLIAL